MKRWPDIIRWPNLVLAGCLAAIPIWAMFTGRIGSCPPSDKPVDIFLLTIFIPQEFCAALVMDALRAAPRDCSALHLALFCWSAAYLPSLIYGRVLIGVWHLIRRRHSR